MFFFKRNEKPIVRIHESLNSSLIITDTFTPMPNLNTPTYSSTVYSSTC